MSQEKEKMTSLQVRKLTYAALFLAIALVLPFLTGQIPEIGRALSPMHIPVLLCGFTCGWPWGLAVGFIAPLLRGLLFGMPVLFPSGVAMAFELAVYGAVSGYLYSILPRKKWMVYVVLIISMIAGRLVWGLVQIVIAGLSDRKFTTAAFLAGAGGTEEFFGPEEGGGIDHPREAAPLLHGGRGINLGQSRQAVGQDHHILLRLHQAHGPLQYHFGQTQMGFRSLIKSGGEHRTGNRFTD